MTQMFLYFLVNAYFSDSFGIILNVQIIETVLKVIRSLGFNYTKIIQLVVHLSIIKLSLHIRAVILKMQELR